MLSRAGKGESCTVFLDKEIIECYNHSISVANCVFIYEFWEPVSETDTLTEPHFFVVFYSFVPLFLWRFTK